MWPTFCLPRRERREKELQEAWAKEHGDEPRPQTPNQDEVDRQELEKIMTDEPLGYASDGEQNNNEENIKNSVSFICFYLLLF